MNTRHTLPHAGRCILAMALTIQLFSSALPARAARIEETVLHNFSAGWLDGASCYGGVIAGKDGSLYGTTWGGGNKAGGTVYKLNTDGTGFTILHNFTNAPDGKAPFASLVQGTDGLLYGTTFYGGVSNNGTVFRIDTNGGSFSVLRSFEGKPDGGNPYAGLIQGRDGSLYGTTQYGGVTNQGAVFKINPDGSGYAVLHSFKVNFVDGSIPYSGLVEGVDGQLYGTTSAGGSMLGGTVYRISPDGDSYGVLRSFIPDTDGAWPKSALVQGIDGALYGTAYSNGPRQNGTVFRIDTNGGFQRLYSFTNSPDGSQTWAGLIQGCDGRLYGTTAWGGSTNGGLLFQLNTDGTGYSILHHFSWSGPDGAHPQSTLAGGGNGVFYGTTVSGGSSGFGTVYRLALQPYLGAERSGTDMRISISGISNQPCRIEYTTNLLNWSTLADMTLTNGMGQYRDPISSGHNCRFYRAVLQ